MWEANPSRKPVIIVDTRPKLNANANKLKGKGFENMQGYLNGILVFHGIENIHAMRESLASLVEVVQGSESMQVCTCALTAAGVSGLLPEPPSTLGAALERFRSPARSLTEPAACFLQSYMSQLVDSKWLAHIRAVMDTTVQIVKYVLAGHSVLIHCSDGWDRTAQTCSLAGFMLEPYYRTIRGFIVLVEKEWLGFGHKMSDRNQFVSGKSGEVSPIFLQFLEATWQISQQYPRAFEFNELFLISMYDCLVSSQFGTYLCNSEKERREAKLSERTQSVS